MPSNHLILCHPLLLPSIFPSNKVFSNELAFHIRWPKYWSFSFSISPPNEYSEFISFRIDWFDLLAVQETLKSLFQHHNLKASVLQYSGFFMVQHQHQQSLICRWHLSNGRKQRGTKEPLDEGKRREWKNWLKIQHSKLWDHGIQSHHFVTIRWGKNGNSARFYFLCLKITVDSECSHEIKIPLLLGRNDMTNLVVIVVVQSLSHFQLFVTPWTAACQVSLSFIIFWSLLRLMSIESVMPFNHLILCHPLILLPSIFPKIRIFFSELVFCIRWPKYWSFNISISPSNEYSGLIFWQT